MKLSWKTCARVGASAFVLFLCVHYWDAFAGLMKAALGAATPLALGCVLAYAINIPMRFYERHYFPNSQRPGVVKSRRPVCLLLALASALAAVALLIVIVAPELVKCVSLMVSQVPGTLEELGDALARTDWLEPRLGAYLADIDWQALLRRGVDVAISGFGSVANVAAGVITSVISWSVTALMAFIFAIYVLAGKERLGRQFKTLGRRYIKESWRAKGRHVLVVVEDCFHDYIVGQCTEAVILGCLCAAGMVIFRFPYAAVVGATVGFTALIPVAGAYIGGAVGFLLMLTASPWKAALFVVYLVVLQQIEGNVIYPKVVGKSLGLPGIWVLAAVIVGGGVFGIVGMMLGVPLAAAIYRLMKEDVARKA